MSTQVHPIAPKVLDTKVQAPVLAAQADVVTEAEGNKGVLMQRMVEVAKQYAQAEDALGKGLGADLVLSIVPLMKLPPKIKPKYAAIAEQIVLAMGRGDVLSRTVLRHPDESIKDKPGAKPAYKQLATRWVDLARWEGGFWNKAEQAHQERTKDWSCVVKHKGQTYDSPVSMLRAGVAYTTVHAAFRNVVRPAFKDFTVLDTKATKRAVEKYVGKAALIIRTVNDDGDPVQGKAPIAENGPLTADVVAAFLGELKAPLHPKRYEQVQNALLLVKPADAPEK